ncbi:helix-turn-helix domain-containing protein [Sphingobium fuliginis]|uniref:helix-turn-helix domain-containing protein n=1 Tax=Sphingobium fuliginis (strain ATCC 27551) TaxID=336203 RepID=UPI0014315AFD|nr:helix-turn-helix domain-containing protein [Sphingobium fuliginis]
MSIRVMSAVWDLDLPDSEKLVALALADWCNDQGECWPSVPQIAKKCSKSERTVQNVTASLEAKGHLTRQMIPGRGCKYHIHPRKDCTTTPAAAAPVNPRKRCTPATAAPVQGTTDTPAAAAPNTSVTVISSEANASSDKRAKAANENWHRLPEGWEPTRPLPPNCPLRSRSGRRERLKTN